MKCEHCGAACTPVKLEPEVVERIDFYGVESLQEIDQAVYGGLVICLPCYNKEKGVQEPVAPGKELELTQEATSIAFLLELETLLAKYDAIICFSCSHFSDVAGLYDEVIEVVFNHNSGSKKEITVPLTQGWCASATGVHNNLLELTK